MKPIKDIEKNKSEKFLIGLIRRQKCLYDDTSPKYRDTEHKRQVWNSIAVKCKMHESVVMRTWKTLRDQFNRELKRLANEPDSEPKFRHYQSLMFLKDFHKPLKRKSKSNGNLEITPEEGQHNFHEENSQIEWYAGDADNYIDEESCAFEHPNEVLSTELHDEGYPSIGNGYQEEDGYFEEDDTLSHLNVKIEEESYIDVDTFCFPNIIKVEDESDDNENEDRQSPSPSPKRKKIDENTTEETPHDVNINKSLSISNAEKSTDEYEKFFSSIAEKVRKANVTDDKFTEIQILVLRIIGEMLKLS